MRRSLFHKQFLMILCGLLAINVACHAEETIEGKTQKVAATFARLPPFSFKGLTSVEGFDVDLIKAIAKEENIPLKVIPFPYGKISEGLQEGIIDVFVSGLLENDERRKLYALSKPYVIAYDTIMYVNPSLHITSDEDVKKLRIATLRNSTQSRNLVNVIGVPPENLVFVDTLYLGYKAMMTNKVDAVSTYDLALRYAVRNKKGDFKYYRLQGLPPHNIVAVGRKGEEKFIQQFNDGLEKIKKNGVYQALYDKWLK